VIISLIAAISENGVIGIGNKLPWHLPADLQFFRRTTLHHPIIMGRKNFESIGKVLHGRTNIVLTKNLSFVAVGVRVANSLNEAFNLAADADECFIIGGSEVYREALPFCQKLYITRVHGVFEGDTYMPEWGDGFRRVSCEKHFKDEKNAWDYDFEVYDSKSLFTASSPS